MKKEHLSSLDFINFIEKICSFDRFSHAYLLEVFDSDDDLDLILSFVKLIFCEKVNRVSDLNCGKCNLCNLIDKRNFPDLKIIDSNGKEIKKQQIIDLQEEFKTRAIFGEKKVYIIKDADMLNSFAANTILKFLEEPEDNIVAILLTKNRFKVLDTIVSRCQCLSVYRGSVFNSELENDFFELFKLITSGDGLFINYNAIINSLMSDKVIAKKKFGDILNILMAYLDFSVCGKGDSNLKDYFDILSSFNILTITKIISIIDKEIKKLDFNVNYKLWLDSIFAQIIGVVKNG